MSFGFGFGFPKRLTSGGGLSPRLYLDFVGTGSLPSTVTFSRGTNATLTDSNGRIAWAPHNLLTNSEDFEAAAWNKNGTTVSGADINATTAPDGTVTADRVRNATSTGNHDVYASTSTIAATYTFSAYLKADGVSWACLAFQTPDGINRGCFFDLANGVRGTEFNSATGTISAVSGASGWYRCTVTATAPTAGTSYSLICVATANGSSRPSYSGDTSQTIFVWGAQLNVANAPVNLLTWSEQFDNAIWGKTEILPFGSGSIANATVAPDGTTTADFVAPSLNNAEHYVGLTTVSGAPTAANIYSIYVKNGGYRYVFLYRARSGGASFNNIFDLQTGTWVQAGAEQTNHFVQPLSNGWYRIGFTGKADGNNGFLFQPSPFSSGSNIQTYTGDGTSGVYVWGAQLNTGSVALPYVATTSSIYLPPAYNSTTPKNLLGFTQEPENAAWTKSNSYVQQNLLTWSQDFDNAAWTKLNSTITADADTAPNGTQTADRWFINNGVAVNFGASGLFTAGSGTNLLTGSVLLQAATYTASFYVQSGSGLSHIQLRMATTSTLQGTPNTCIIKLSDGTVHATDGTTVVSNAGGNWWRVQHTFTATATSWWMGFWVWNDANITCNGTQYYRIWGAQLVQGSTAGDYTQTTSAAAPTRYLNWDGTLTGRKLVEDTATGDHRAFQAFSVPVVGVPYTYAVYAKAAERSRIQLTSATGVVLDAVFDLATGTVVTTISGTPSITNVGGGWYRCAITSTSTAAVGTNLQARLIQSGTTNSYTGDGTSGIYVSDFQLSNSASVDPYVYNPQAAAASAAFYGPRFDYNPTGTPIPSGVELVTNGTFDSATGWSTGGAWVISGGAASITASVASLSQSTLAAVAGRTYQVTFTISSFTSGAIRVEFGGVNGTTRNAAGTYTQYITASSTAFLVISPTTTSTLSVDNISVQEVTGYTATANGLLIEEQRTNLLTYSEQFDNAAWNKTNLNTTGTPPWVNVAVAPDGATTADKLIATTTNSIHRTFQAVSKAAAAQTLTFSCYVKAAGYGFALLRMFDTTETDSASCAVNLTTGEILTAVSGFTGVSGAAVNVGNSWWRVSVTATTDAETTVQPAVFIQTSLSTSASIFAGNDSDGLFVWGAQLEAGAFATSYIPTQASQVTRNADSASMLGDNFYTWFNQGAGTINASFSYYSAIPATGNRGGILGFGPGTYANANSINIFQEGGGQNLSVLFTATTHPDVSFSRSLNTAANAVNNFAFAYSQIANSYAVSTNGQSPGTATSTQNNGSFNSMVIGARNAGNGYTNGHIRRIGYYNTRLPDSTLTALTT